MVRTSVRAAVVEQEAGRWQEMMQNSMRRDRAATVQPTDVMEQSSTRGHTGSVDHRPAGRVPSGSMLVARHS